MASHAEIRSINHDKPKGSRSRSKRAGLEFSISKVEQYLKMGRYAQHIGASASVYLTAVLEYIVVELFTPFPARVNFFFYMVFDVVFFIGFRVSWGHRKGFQKQTNFAEIYTTCDNT